MLEHVQRADHDVNLNDKKINVCIFCTTIFFAGVCSFPVRLTKMPCMSIIPRR